jgi:hypothetical protein
VRDACFAGKDIRRAILFRFPYWPKERVDAAICAILAGSPIAADAPFSHGHTTGEQPPTYPNI